MRLSRIVRHVAAFSLAVIFVALSHFCAQQVRAADRAGVTIAQSATAEDTDSSSSADDLVRQALKAEIDGDSQRRAAYLVDALAADPDNAPAHWHSAEVRTGDHWTTIADAANAARQAGKVAKYRQMREHASHTVVGHLSLARWCAAAGLTDSERVHLILAMQLSPTKIQSRDIIRKLGLVRYQGQLVFPAQAEKLKADLKRSASALQDWKPRLTRLRKEIDVRDAKLRADAITELRAVRDPAAIPGLESVFRKAGPIAGEAVVAALAQMPEQAATDSLLRFAILADDEEVRAAAATALGKRNIFAYVPTLIAGLESLIEVQFTIDSFEGLPRHRLSMYRDGPNANYSLVHQDGIHENMTYGLTSHRLWFDFQGDNTLASDAITAQQELAANEVRAAINGRIVNVLNNVLGKDLEPDPATIWKWWLDYNEMYQPQEKPVVQTANTYQPISWRYIISCFPAGTPVETSTGTLTIEQIKPGDCVLAQYPDSGELAYKPVMAVTLRPPSPLIEVRTEKDTVRATRGHPFWVSGIGWQMAKELKAGQWLHTVAGPVRIESADERGEAECHNLVVADFNSYFVGRDRVLVHDNNLRQVTTATVPGFVSP